jgi:hypothetical protein
LGVLGCAFFLGSAALATTGNDKCTNAMIKDANKIDATQGKEVSACVKNIGKGKVPASEACLTLDAKQKVQKAKAKLDADFGKQCGTLPGYGPGSPTFDPARLKLAAMMKNLWLKMLVFGNDIGLPGVIADCATNKPDCKCQQAVIKDLLKIEKTKLKECAKAIKAGLKAGTITDQASLSAECLNAILADVKGKILKTILKLGADIGKKCPANPFIGGGMCDGLPVPLLVPCLDATVECEVCLYLKNIGIFDDSVNCDLFDNGLADGSCCKMKPGNYALTQGSGGTLAVDGLPAFPFPSGGYVNQDVGPAGPGCIHATTIPFPGGFSAPPFCVPALGFSVSVVQTGCGIGQIDDDGGSDYTITEIGDTSSPIKCALPASACPPPPGDSNQQADVTVGDGIVDSCPAGTCSNMFYTVPVFTTTWVDAIAPTTCPDGDGTYNAGTDILVVSFPQILDFTTDATTSTWADLDPDGCFLSGAGPGGAGLSGAGVCLDPLTGAVGTAASGTIGSNGGPLYDLTFLTQLPNTLTGPTPLVGATCATPPLIAIPGTVTRCIP